MHIKIIISYTLFLYCNQKSWSSKKSSLLFFNLLKLFTFYYANSLLLHASQLLLLSFFFLFATFIQFTVTTPHTLSSSPRYWDWMHGENFEITFQISCHVPPSMADMLNSRLALSHIKSMYVWLCVCAFVFCCCSSKWIEIVLIFALLSACHWQYLHPCSSARTQTHATHNQAHIYLFRTSELLENLFLCGCVCVCAFALLFSRFVQ